MIDPGAQAPAELIAKARQLSPRHRDCLRLVYQRRTSKEIAAILGLAPGTVSTYCTEAIRILDARDRRHAAELLALCEGAPAAAPATPSEIQPVSEGVNLTQISEQSSARAAPPLAKLLPFRTKGGTPDDFPLFYRLLWIPCLVFMLALGFSAVVAALHLLSEIHGRAPAG